MALFGEAKREYQRRWMAARRGAWLAANGPCAACGSTRDLQVDHVDPSAKECHRVWSWSAERRAVELAKCQVLCQPCHQAKTERDQGYPKEHGASRYVAGCRCDVCRAAACERVIAWRKRTGRR